MSTDLFSFDSLCKSGINGGCAEFLFTRTAISIVVLLYGLSKASQLYTLLNQGKNLKLNSFTVYLECFTSLKIIIYSWYQGYSYFSYIEYLTVFFFNILILFVWLKSQTSTNFIIKSTIRLILSVCLYCIILIRITDSRIQYFVHVGTLTVILMFGNELLDFFSSYYNFSSIMQQNGTIPSQILQKQHPDRISRMFFVVQLIVLVARMWALAIEYPDEKVLQSHYLIRFVCTTLLLIQVMTLNHLSKKQPQHHIDAPQRSRQQQQCQDKMASIAQFNTVTSPAISDDQPQQRYHNSSTSSRLQRKQRQGLQ